MALASSKMSKLPRVPCAASVYTPEEARVKEIDKSSSSLYVVVPLLWRVTKPYNDVNL